MGLVKEGDRTAVLSDILGDEDHLGDMDFKVAGTVDGITGFQMDIKIQGITLELMATALEQARAGRLHKLEKMNAVISAPKGELSKYAPRFTSIRIPTDLIGSVIGPGGKMIRSIVADSGADSINIEDDGTIQIAATSQTASDRALALINAIVAVPEIGKTYKATVKRIMDFGAFAEILPGKEGLIHISQLDTKRVAKVSDVVKVGDVFDVMLMEIDEKGRMNLSRKALLGQEKKEPVPEKQPLQ
jgi:polyribonucleotide nucleotidyltransferase